MNGSFCFASTEKLELADLETRKSLLQEILQSSLLEINNLKDILNKIEVNTEDWQSIKDNYLRTLNEFEDYYKNLENKLSDEAIAVKETKTIAAELKDWREQIYSPQLKSIMNMALIFQNEKLLKTVFSRLEKISADIKKLNKQNLIKTDVLIKSFNQAENLLKEAQTKNEKAKILFLEAILITENKNQETKNPVNEPEKKELDRQEAVRETIKESLKNIKAAYEIFFQMNTEFKKSF